MSRNLCRTDCAQCDSPVQITGVPYALPVDHFSKPGMVVADAECVACRTKYTAWIGGDSGGRGYDRKTLGFYDISYRSTFNDEPGIDDVPAAEIKSFHVVTVNGRVVRWSEQA